MQKTPLLFAIIFASILILNSSIAPAKAWSNGGYSTDATHPAYGTHDWIAQHALDWLPTNEKQYITDNLVAYLYGTELPDNSQAPDGIGDTTKHHVYYWANGTLQDDASALRASVEYQSVLTFLNAKDYADASKAAGIMSHYIADVGVFAHVMGAATDWGAETGNVHSNYESYVNTRTSSYNDTYNSYMLFDGKLDLITAYNATLNLAYDTTFDHSGVYTCLWMNNNYNISNALYWNRAGESLNLAVNAVADVLHTLYINSNPIPTSAPTGHIVINEMEQNPTGTDAGNEYVELYDPTENSVDISGWTVSTTAGSTVTLTISPGTIIQSNGYHLVVSGSQWLDNNGESAILRNFTGTEVDRTPSLSDTHDDGRSWQRYPNGQDTDLAADWAFLSSTKGVSNGGTTTPAPVPTPTPTSTQTPTPTPSPTLAPTLTPTITPIPTLTSSPTPILPIPTATVSPSQSASGTPDTTSTPAQTPTMTPSSSQNPTPLPASPAITEFPSVVMLAVLAVLIFVLAIFAKKRMFS